MFGHNKANNTKAVDRQCTLMAGEWRRDETRSSFITEVMSVYDAPHRPRREGVTCTRVFQLHLTSVFNLCKQCRALASAYASFIHQNPLTIYISVNLNSSYLPGRCSSSVGWEMHEPMFSKGSDKIYTFTFFLCHLSNCFLLPSCFLSVKLGWAACLRLTIKLLYYSLLCQVFMV